MLKKTKERVHYVAHASERWCERCVSYQDHSCTIVAGTILPGASCDLYKPGPVKQGERKR